MRLIWVLALLGLAACRPEMAAQDMAASCGAEGLQDLVGQPKAVLQTMRFSQNLRVLSPGDAVTKDYRPDRLNIHLDDGGIIRALRCG